MRLLNYNDVNALYKRFCPDCGTEDLWQVARHYHPNYSWKGSWCATCGRRDGCCAKHPVLEPLDISLFTAVAYNDPRLRYLVSANTTFIPALYHSLVQQPSEQGPRCCFLIVHAPGLFKSYPLDMQFKGYSGWISLNWPAQCSEIVECHDLLEGLQVRSMSPDLIGGRAVLVPTATAFSYLRD